MVDDLFTEAGRWILCDVRAGVEALGYGILGCHEGVQWMCCGQHPAATIM